MQPFFGVSSPLFQPQEELPMVASRFGALCEDLEARAP